MVARFSAVYLIACPKQAYALSCLTYTSLNRHLDVLQELRDTYSGVPVMLFAVRPALCVGEGVSQSAVPQRHILSEALSYALLSQESDTFSVIQAPVSYSAFENLNLVPGNIYHDSAVCAASIDTVTLPLRLSAGLGAYNALGEQFLFIGMTDNKPTVRLNACMCQKQLHLAGDWFCTCWGSI